ncbi:MAG: iron ABC transporter permease [Ramlibacter sp.]|jgi:iron(III) transport system permease protein|uniref:ABC transporter permease n=1 Tax=Ramlibacter sp. TaxID=1917967 RepID=UPI00261B6549|nr:iron ABC transporter permease [Ramlibacter sp.]MDH4376343.1 iron ABC transporter permease [Ramlibacter sp.]
MRVGTGRTGLPAGFEVLLVASLVLVTVFLVYPLGVAVFRTLGEAPAGIAAIGKSIESGALLRVLRNTAIIVFGGAALATVVGAVLAFINERTDGSLGASGELLPLAPMIVPPIAGVIGWAILLDPRVGLVNGALKNILERVGITLDSGPLDIYTPTGLVFVTGLYLVPYVYLIVAAALRGLDASLDEASRVHGASPLRTMLRVTLPAVRPAIAAGALTAVIGGIGLFSVPIVLGTAARMDVISVHIYRLFEQFPPQTATGLMLSAAMVAVVQALLLAQRWLVPSEGHAVIGGRGGRAGLIRLGRWRRPAQGLAIGYLLATSVLPVLGLAIVSLQPFWTPIIDSAQFTLANYTFVLFENGPTSRAFVTSLGLGAATATAAVLIAALLLLGSRQSQGAVAKASDMVLTLPATLPHTVIGVAFLITFTPAPFKLYGTTTLLFLAYLAMALPFAARAAAAAASGIGADLSEASRIAGAGRGRTFLRILLPLSLPGLMAGWIIVFIHTAGEVTASSLLAGARNPVIGRVMTELWVFGSFPQLAAMSIVVTAVTSTGVAVMLYFTRRATLRG